MNDNADKEVAATPIQVKQPAKAAKKEAAKTITKANGYYCWPKGVTGWTVVLVTNQDE